MNKNYNTEENQDPAEHIVSNIAAIQSASDAVHFQLSNVDGWIMSKKYESALIKCEYLVKAAQELEATIKLMVEIEKINTPKTDNNDN